jgi:GAF domain-containing protein
MAQHISLPITADRAVIYRALLPQIKSLIESEPDLIANLANVVAVLKEAFHFFWIGFYLVKDQELVLAPFQGTVACTRIAFTRGVCGHCYTHDKTVLVPDVSKFEGHIACSSLSQSEIVLPIHNAQGKVVGVLDIDSDKINNFSSVDVVGLEDIVQLLEQHKIFN